MARHEVHRQRAVCDDERIGHADEAAAGRACKRFEAALDLSSRANLDRVDAHTEGRRRIRDGSEVERATCRRNVRVEQGCDAPGVRSDLLAKFEPFAGDHRFEMLSR